MASSQSVRNPRGAKRRVFLAEDHKLVREGLAALLEMTGEFEIVGQCGHGLHVGQQIVDARPEAVVLDVNMPGVNGIEICRELTRTLPDMAVLMLSMQGNEAFIIRALEHGAMGYLLKESAGTDLVEALKTIMAGSIYLGPGIDRGILKRWHRPRPT